MQKEQTVKSRKLSWSKGLLALLSLAVLAAGQLLSQSVGTLLSFAQFPVDLCNLAVGVVYVLSVLYGLSWVCKALGLSLADCRILPVHFSLLWTVIALAMPGIVCLILLNLPGSWEVAPLSHEQLAALLSAAVCVIGLGAGIVEEAIFRGVFFTVLERLMGRWAAVLLPSVLFAALHLIGRPMDLPSFLQLMIAGSLVGILFSLVTLENNSIWSAALMHGVWNLVMVGGLLHIGTVADSDVWVLAAGQLLSQSVGTLLSFAQFPVDLCNLAVGVVYVLSVLYGLSWVCKALGLSLADCRILPVHFSLLWTVIALAMPGIVCLILLNLPGSWEVAPLSHEQLAALLSAAVCVIGLGAGIVEEAIFRGVFFTVLERLMGRWAAVLLPSVLFAALHLIGRPMDLPSFLQLMIAGSLVGILFSLVTLENNSIWSAALMHGVWNLVMVGGLLHIGTVADSDVWVQYLLDSDSLLLTGGDFGIEASIVSIVVYLAFACLNLSRCRRKGLLEVRGCKVFERKEKRN